MRIGLQAALAHPQLQFLVLGLGVPISYACASDYLLANSA